MGPGPGNQKIDSQMAEHRPTDSPISHSNEDSLDLSLAPNELPPHSIAGPVLAEPLASSSSPPDDIMRQPKSLSAFAPALPSDKPAMRLRLRRPIMPNTTTIFLMPNFFIFWPPCPTSSWTTCPAQPTSLFTIFARSAPLLLFAVPSRRCLSSPAPLRHLLATLCSLTLLAHGSSQGIWFMALPTSTSAPRNLVLSSKSSGPSAAS